MTEAATASVFMSGRSQAVRIPKAFRLDAKRVKIRRRGETLVIEPMAEEDPWANLKSVAGTFEGVNWGAMAGKREETRGFPRMEFGESAEDFERRVREYESGRGRRGGRANGR